MNRVIILILICFLVIYTQPPTPPKPYQISHVSSPNSTATLWQKPPEPLFLQVETENFQSPGAEVQNLYSAIFGSGASGYFFNKNTPKQNLDHTAPQIWVGTDSGHPMTSASTCDILFPQIPSNFPTTVDVLPVLQENLFRCGVYVWRWLYSHIYEECSQCLHSYWEYHHHRLAWSWWASSLAHVSTAQSRRLTSAIISPLRPRNIHARF